MARTPFKLKSGNATPFKQMGSSPAKNMKTGDYNQSFESPAKSKFGDEYRRNRSAGVNTFTYEGKSYSTESRSEKEARGGKGTYTNKRAAKANKAAETRMADVKAKVTAKDEQFKQEVRKTLVAKGQKETKAIVKEGAASITKKDLRKEKKAKIKATRAQARSLKGTEGVSRKDIRKAKKADIKATRKEYKTAKKDLKTLKKTTADY